MTKAIAVKEKKEKINQIIERACTEQANTLAYMGIDPKDFQNVMINAILHTPDVIKASPNSLMKAVRKCCRGGIMPDGEQGALIVNNKGDVNVYYMVTGLKRILFEHCGAEITSGVVYDGDDYESVRGGGQDTVQSIRITTKGTDAFKKRDPKNIVGAWCVITIEDHKYIREFTTADIEICKGRSASSSRGDSPWTKHFAKMVEKSCIKSTIMDIRHIIFAKREGQTVEQKSIATGILETIRDEDAPVDVPEDDETTEEVVDDNGVVEGGEGVVTEFEEVDDADAGEAPAEGGDAKKTQDKPKEQTQSAPPADEQPPADSKPADTTPPPPAGDTQDFLPENHPNGGDKPKETTNI